MTCRAEGYYIKGRCFLERVAYFLKLYYLVNKKTFSHAYFQSSESPSPGDNTNFSSNSYYRKSLCHMTYRDLSFCLSCQLLLQIQVTLKQLYVILWERKAGGFYDFVGARPILHVCACALIKKSDGFSITSHTCALMWNETERFDSIQQINLKIYFF